MKIFFKILVMMLIIAGISQVVAQQQAPETPLNFKAFVEETSAGTAVIFKWETNPHGIIPNAYHIYYTDNNANKMILLGKVQHLENQNEYKHIINQLKPGTYSFTITAVAYLNGAIIESRYAQYITLKIGDPRQLYIVSQPVIQAKIGEKYFYSLKVHSLMSCEIKYELITHPEGMTMENNNIMWVPEKAGEYKVSVRVSYSHCSIEAHDVQSFVIKVGDNHNGQLYVKIRIEEAIKMQLGTTMTLKLFAESNANCPVVFDFPHGLPDGFHFDGKEILVMSAQKAGEYVIVIRATLSCDPNISDLRKVIVYVYGGHEDPKHCAWIKGKVYTEDNLPVLEGTVNALKLDRNSKNEQPIFKAKIAEGSFELNVPEGNYALDISGSGFYPEWYEDAEFVTEAKRITIACEETYELNAYVKSLPVPKHFTVSGRVYNKTTDEGILAQVEFIPSEKMYNNSGSKENARFITKTDHNGHYTITLPDNYSYIAQAVSMMNSLRFEVVYYKDAQTPMDAELIKLTGNLENIDFALTPYKEIRSGFTGSVINKDGEPIQGKLIAYCIKTQNDYFKEVKTTYTAETDDNGYFRFENLIPGDYIVQSIPMSKDYVPGYYNKNDFVVLNWKESAIISVGEVMIEMLFDFKHHLRSEMGLVKIGGKIVNKGGYISTKGNELQSGIPVSGAFVYILDENGNVCDYVFSNNEGAFDMKEVAEGTLRIFADKVGMETYEGTIETNYNEKSNVQLEFGMEEVVLDVDDENFNTNTLQTYPIPAIDFVNIIFNTESDNAKVLIHNLLGIELLNREFSVVKGENNLSLDLSSLPTGSYIINISTGTRVINKSIQVIR
jgi:hypothetical protein